MELHLFFFLKSDTYVGIIAEKRMFQSLFSSSGNSNKKTLTLQPTLYCSNFMVFPGCAKHLSEQIINVNSIPSVTRR